MKAICVIAGDNVVVDGDVIFNIPKRSGTEYSYYAHGINKLSITNTLTIHKWCRSLGFKLAILWFWHMVILRKSHVYFTGVLK